MVHEIVLVCSGLLGRKRVMNEHPTHDVTLLLSRVSAWRRECAWQVARAGLRRPAASGGGLHADERSDHTLQATALVHEGLSAVGGLGNVTWENRAQFFAVAAQVMRRVPGRPCARQECR